VPEDAADPAGDILAYLRAHPQASDSLEGIVSWWLPARFMAARESVQESLDRLAAQGLVERTRLADGTIVYGRAEGGASS
jgi:Fe2+ or Zn2+ uptake regulation protein